MAKETKSFILRIPPHTMAAIERWAADEFRSCNGQILWMLEQMLKQAHRYTKPGE
jgi:hypothetical protein